MTSIKNYFANKKSNCQILFSYISSIHCKLNITLLKIHSVSSQKNIWNSKIGERVRKSINCGNTGEILKSNMSLWHQRPAITVLWQYIVSNILSFAINSRLIQLLQQTQLNENIIKSKKKTKIFYRANYMTMQIFSSK